MSYAHFFLFYYYLLHQRIRGMWHNLEESVSQSKSTLSQKPKLSMIERGHQMDRWQLRARVCAWPEISSESNSLQTLQKYCMANPSQFYTCPYRVRCKQVHPWSLFLPRSRQFGLPWHHHCWQLRPLHSSSPPQWRNISVNQKPNTTVQLRSLTSFALVVATTVT